MEATVIEPARFDYQLAYSRNLGWLHPDEQTRLSRVKVGIIGMGGVGGQYVEVLARLGVQNFLVADFDSFSIENTNRQNECKTSNYTRNKAEVLSELVHDINPHAAVTCWSQGLREEDVRTFCQAVDIYLDGLDFFEIELRRRVFRQMREFGKTAITAAPVGCGTSMLVFTPDSMSFDEYFGIKDQDTDLERYGKFLLGLDTGFHMTYLMDSTRMDLKRKKAPSLPMGVYSCAAVVASTVLKVVLGRGKVYVAPWVFHYDPYLLKTSLKRMCWGFGNPIQKLKLRILKKRFAGQV